MDEPNQNPTPNPVAPQPNSVPASAYNPVLSPVSRSATPRPKNFIPIVIGGAVVGLLFLLIIGVSVGITLIQSAFRYTPPPASPPPAPEITIKPINNKWASDSSVLKLRDDLKVLSQSIDTVDLIEPQISPPALDLSISIKTNP